MFPSTDYTIQQYLFHHRYQIHQWVALFHSLVSVQLQYVIVESSDPCKCTRTVKIQSWRSLTVILLSNVVLAHVIVCMVMVLFGCTNSIKVTSLVNNITHFLTSCISSTAWTSLTTKLATKPVTSGASRTIRTTITTSPPRASFHKSLKLRIDVILS